jgi:hypothetical protein
LIVDFYSQFFFISGSRWQKDEGTGGKGKHSAKLDANV